MYGPIQPSCLTSVNPLQRQLADSIVKMSPLDEIRILLATGAKANEPVTQGLRPLHYAVWQRYPEAALLLLVRGGDVNATDECGYSALHLSAEHGYADLAALLLNHGAKVDFRENTGELFPRTTVCDEPLRLAIRNKHLELARMLLEHGADPNKRYFFGSEINLVSPLDIVFMRLLLTYGADPNSRDRSGLTPLMKAARLPQGMDSVLLLLSHGADVNAMADERHDFRTVLHYAILGGNAAVVNLLIKQGAKLNYATDMGKPSPLDLAIVRGDPELVKLLIQAGSSVNACSPVLGSPMHVACCEGVPSQMEILSLLLEAGADPNLVVESDEGPPLRPVLAEYLANNDKPSHRLVSLLIRHGAKVVMKTQFRHPCGILNSLQHIRHNPVLFDVLLDAAESFDTFMIKRNIHFSPEQKEIVLRAAATPSTLRQQSRLIVRQLLGDNLVSKVTQLHIPIELHQYLLYEFS